MMTEEEMGYKGGWLKFIASVCCAVAGVVADYAGDHGWISKSDANAISAVCTAASVVLSLGTIGTAMNATKIAKLGKEVYSISSKGKIRTTTSVLKECKASIVSDSASYTYSASRQLGFSW